jgi:hypothetical protein
VKLCLFQTGSDSGNLTLLVFVIVLSHVLSYFTFAILENSCTLKDL